MASRWMPSCTAAKAWCMPASAISAAWVSRAISAGDLTALICPSTWLASRHCTRGSTALSNSKSATGQKSRSRPIRARDRPRAFKRSPNARKACRASNAAGRSNPTGRDALKRPFQPARLRPGRCQARAGYRRSPPNPGGCEPGPAPGPRGPAQRRARCKPLPTAQRRRSVSAPSQRRRVEKRGNPGRCPGRPGEALRFGHHHSV